MYRLMWQKNYYGQTQTEIVFPLYLKEIESKFEIQIIG